jgi:hypothetical protein
MTAVAVVHQTASTKSAQYGQLQQIKINYHISQ